MIKIFSTDKIKDLDQYTITHEPISEIELVERAALAFTSEFSRRFSKQNRIVIFAGPGNNGADALAIARLLYDLGYRTESYLFNPQLHLSRECELNKQRLISLDKIEFTEVTAEFVPPELTAHDVVIDGLFGSGLNKPLTGGFAAMVNYINQSESTVVAIDCPSGLYGEDNKDHEKDAIIRAELTLTFAFPKLSFLFAENEKYVGEWKVLDILIHPDIIEKVDSPYYLITEEDIAGVFNPRDKFAHKGIFGHALLIAGSKGKMGAAVLASKACLRSGAGMLTTHIPQRGEQILQTSFPEAMVNLDSNKDYFTEIPNLKPYDAIGVGPGLGQQFDSVIALESLLVSSNGPMVIDADAINFIAANTELVNRIPERSILTPHTNEFDRLAGKSTDSYERLQKAQEYAVKHKVCIILKGAYTATCTPGGNVYINNSGNPGMATAGSGDVLTGIILGLLAQGYEPETCAVAGVYIHGIAGDLASAFHSEESMISGDIIDMLGKAFKQLK